jgi:hypothetical protein
MEIIFKVVYGCIIYICISILLLCFSRNTNVIIQQYAFSVGFCLPLFPTVNVIGKNYVTVTYALKIRMVATYFTVKCRSYYKQIMQTNKMHFVQFNLIFHNIFYMYIFRTRTLIFKKTFATTRVR